MKTPVIDEGRELTREECVEIAKEHGITVVMMVESTDATLVGEVCTKYKVTGW